MTRSESSSVRLPLLEFEQGLSLAKSSFAPSTPIAIHRLHGGRDFPEALMDPEADAPDDPRPHPVADDCLDDHHWADVGHVRLHSLPASEHEALHQIEHPWKVF